MGSSSEIVVILQDATGEHYLITRAMLDEARATPEQHAALTAAQAPATDDAAGYIAGLALGGLLPGLEIVSPRDSASGLPTGKRQHKPLTITKELDRSSPLLF
jgi:hypothetical protein